MPAAVATQASAQEQIWPRWTPLIEAAIATVLAVLVAFEARPGLSVTTRIVAATSPAVLWMWCATPKRPPFWLRAVVVLGSVTLLISHPAKFDAAPFFLVLLIGESVAVEAPRQGIAIAVVSAALITGLDIAGRFDGSIVWLLAFSFTWSGAALIQSRVRLIDQISEQAAVRERERIARELHDVIAHSLAVTMLHLTGARLALERDPADAAQALLEAERLGRQSLAEIRRTIGLLAPGDEDPTSALPTAADIPDLVREVADAGLSVRFDCDGDLQDAPMTAGLSLYRIVQESLSNIVKHTPGAEAHIQVRIDADRVTVDISNPLTSTAPRPSREGGGMGLVLMRERAELLGGTLRAGPDGEHWRVCVDLPTRLDA